MHGTTLVTGWDTVLLMVPFAVLMFLAMFGLDAHIAASRQGRGRRPRLCEIDAAGQPLMWDPDGKTWCGLTAPRRAWIHRNGAVELSSKSTELEAIGGGSSLVMWNKKGNL